jgi:hypothetical protein
MRIIPEITFESKNMMTVYNYNFVGLMNRSVTAPSTTILKSFKGYSHDIHSLIGKSVTCWKVAEFIDRLELIVFVLIYMARDDRCRHLIAALRAATALRQPRSADIA